MAAPETLGQQFKIVKTKSIPNVDADRLRDSIGQIHNKIHTPEGLHDFDETRRAMADLGIKSMKIRDELKTRGEESGISCRWCGTSGP